jgi:AraC-like DNA-binding protein
MIFCANSPQQDLQNKPVAAVGEAVRVPTVKALSIVKIVDSVARFGNADRLLRTIGLDRQAVVDPDIRIPFADMLMLSDRAASMTKDAAFGLHVGERVPESEYGLLGNLVLSSSSLREALECLIRFSPIWTTGGVFRLDVEGNVAHFQWEYARVSLPDPRHDCEMSMATMIRLNRLTANERWWPKEVWFQHAKPPDTSEHARTFRAPVRFGMPANVLLFDIRVLDLPSKTPRPGSHRLMTMAAEQLLSEGGPDVSVSRLAATFIRENLGKGPVEIEAVAHALGFSRRSFQRRLQQESTSYRDLMEQVRRDLSEYLLLDTGITSTATAYALGYSEHSVFHRAFQKWHGKAPGDYRHSSAERVVPD